MSTGGSENDTIEELPYHSGLLTAPQQTNPFLDMLFFLKPAVWRFTNYPILG